MYLIPLTIIRLLYCSEILVSVSNEFIASIFRIKMFPRL